MNANEALRDAAVNYAHDLIQFERGVVYRMIAVLNRADAQLMAQLTEALMQIDAGSFSIQRLEQLIVSTRAAATNLEAFQAIMDALEPSVRDAAKVESAMQYASLQAAVPAAVQLHYPIARVSLEQVYAAAMSRPFQGRLLKDWGADLAAARMKLVRDTVRIGFTTGETTADIIRKLRGTRALKYSDGVLERSRRDVAAVVQTALSHTAETARQAFTAANADLVKAVQWVSTLDNRTTSQCRVRDGLQYTPDTHKPIGHAVPWGAGPGRLHFNCRSVYVNVTKSWRELGIPIDDLPPETRASMDGQVPGDMTYGEWFARQSPERQDEIVGKRRGELYRAGKITFDQFSDDKGQWLSLAEVLARIKGA